MGKPASSKKTCFVIGPIGKENSEVRKDADRLFKFIISPVVEKMGFETPQRADHIPNPGTITSQVIEQLIDSNLVIADLTAGNPNVFYELAVRHVTKKHCIHVVKSDCEIPFDTSPNRTIQYNLDLEGVDNAKIALEDQINSLVDGKDEVDNPIGIALTMKDLKSSGNSMQIIMADLTEEVRDLRGEMRSFLYVCKQTERDKSIPQSSDESRYYPKSKFPEIKDSVLFIDPEQCKAHDLLRAKKELEFLEKQLRSPKISKEMVDHIRQEISSLEMWIRHSRIKCDPK